MTKKMSLKV